MSDKIPEKIEPCAWCGKEPRAEQHSVFAERIDYSCCGPTPNYGCGEWNWNAYQRAILDRRRADFEAGRKSVPGFFSDDFSIDDDFAAYLSRPKDDA